MTPSQEKAMYDLDIPIWSIHLVLKHCPQYRKQLWSIISDADKDKLKAAAGEIKS
jgi:hypothetical protein